MDLRGNKKYGVLVIDDDRIAISELKKAMAKHHAFSIDGEACNTADGKELLMKLRPDLLFLDVELPDMQGVDFLNSIRESITWQINVVFYSAHSKYILSAMRESAFDYLLKPFEQPELDGIIDRFIKDRTNNERKRAENHITNANPLQNSFLAATLTGYKIVHAEDIGYFVHKGLRKQWEAKLIGKESLCLRRGTSAETILGYSNSFVQISQSCIININYLAMIYGNDCKLYPPFDDSENLQISRNYLRKLQELLKTI